MCTKSIRMICYLSPALYPNGRNKARRKPSYLHTENSLREKSLFKICENRWNVRGYKIFTHFISFISPHKRFPSSDIKHLSIPNMWKKGGLPLYHYNEHT